MSRLGVRMWLVSTVGEMASRLATHWNALDMEPRGERSDSMLSVARIVGETVPPKGGFPDGGRVNPTLAAEVTRAILTGSTYPRSLLAGVIDRARIEGLADSQTRNDYRDAQYRRCAVIRACLTRNHSMEVPVALDLERTDPPYLLGRLFAVLERIQENALGQINRTIKDSYYGSGSSTPAAIFPRLISLSRHHLNKIENPGQRTLREKELGGIMDGLSRFPGTLGMEAQGLFAIGYYHQRQSYFKGKAESDQN
jgi:CRISPR-associated protein Csd1